MMSSSFQSVCPSYDQDLIVRELTSLYQLLTRVHIAPSELLLPPDGGWPALTPQYLRPMGKTARVNELIRHLPYIRREQYDNKTTIWRESACIDYRGANVTHLLRQSKDPDVDACDVWWTTPAHVVTLSEPSQGRYGYHLLLDTERGTVSTCDYMEGPDKFPRYQNYKLGSNDPDIHGDGWKDHHAFSVSDLCEIIKQDWTSMNMIATSAEEYETKSWHDQATLDKFRKIFENHNWLRKGYKQEECLKASKELADERRRIRRENAG